MLKARGDSTDEDEGIERFLTFANHQKKKNKGQKKKKTVSRRHGFYFSLKGVDSGNYPRSKNVYL